jgi:hypothetical protein
MNTRCKAGDLAYLSSECVDEGVIVEVLSAGPMTYMGPSWFVRSRTPIQVQYRESGCVAEKTELYIEDVLLRPITGLLLTEETRDEQKEPA